MGASLALSPSWPHWVGTAVIILSFVVGLARHVLLDWSDPMHCTALLTRGGWLDSSRKNWQPDGCMLNSYTQDQASACLHSKPIIFIGDSVARTLFFRFTHIVDLELPTSPPNDTQKHSNHILHTATGSDISFFWDPFLNTSRTFDILHRAKNGTSADERPALLVLGSGLWYLRYANTSGGLPSWEANMERIFNVLAHNRDKPADQVVILPVEQVVPAKLSYDRALSIRPSDIDAMNSDLYHRIHRPSYNTFSIPSTSAPSLSVAFPIVFNQMLDSSHTEDGLHFSNSLVALQANILFNLRCNDQLPKKFPMDKTCCYAYPWPSFLHSVTLGLAIIWGPIVYLLSPHTGRRGVPWAKDPKISALIFSGGLGLIFAADRTALWLKEQKQFNPWTFGFLCLLSLTIGMLTIKQTERDPGFLSREQTDEWKGWMQIAILIYHYCGASKVPGIYNPIRVLVASYLFMTGYGHTTFYLKKADFGFSRIAQILVRLNLLTIFLAYIMNTDYISYYFSPLVSMWFLIVYATMAIASTYNNRTPFLVCKIMFSASVVSWFMKQGWLLQNLFYILSRIGRIHWSAREWGFRVNLDLWIVYVGMLTAVVVAKVGEHRLTEHPWWPSIVKVSLGASGTIIMWFFAFELHQESKFTYNRWHPYVSFLPVLAFIVLRNGSVVLRSASSSAFAFIGRCSLETFIIQYHLWLAADTKGILLVLPGTRWRPLNFVLTTIMFIFVSDQMARSTTQLTSWICGETTKSPPLPTTAPVANTCHDDAISTPNQSHDSIPLIPPNHHTMGKTDERSTLPREPDNTLSPPRWVDRLAEGSAHPARSPGFRVWSANHAEKYGPKTKLIIGVGLMWIANVLWSE